MLIRPYPSLRITFTSPSLRISGLLQSRFLDRIGGSPNIREGIMSAMSSGVGVTAKITWLSQPLSADTAGHGQSGAQSPGGRNSYDNASVGSLTGSVTSASGRRGQAGQNQQRAGSEEDGQPRWIHCTPLLGSDDRVGVWMVVVVEGETITGGLSGVKEVQSPRQSAVMSPTHDVRDGGSTAYGRSMGANRAAEQRTSGYSQAGRQLPTLPQGQQRGNLQELSHHQPAPQTQTQAQPQGQAQHQFQPTQSQTQPQPQPQQPHHQKQDSQTRNHPAFRNPNPNPNHTFKPSTTLNTIANAHTIIQPDHPSHTQSHSPSTSDRTARPPLKSRNTQDQDRDGDFVSYHTAPTSPMQPSRKFIAGDRDSGVSALGNYPIYANGTKSPTHGRQVSNGEGEQEQQRGRDERPRERTMYGPAVATGAEPKTMAGARILSGGGFGGGEAGALYAEYLRREGREIVV